MSDSARQQLISYGERRPEEAAAIGALATHFEAVIAGKPRAWLRVAADELGNPFAAGEGGGQELPRAPAAMAVALEEAWSSLDQRPAGTVLQLRRVGRVRAGVAYSLPKLRAEASGKTETELWTTVDAFPVGLSDLSNMLEEYEGLHTAHDREAARAIDLTARVELLELVGDARVVDRRAELEHQQRALAGLEPELEAAEGCFREAGEGAMRTVASDLAAREALKSGQHRRDKEVESRRINTAIELTLIHGERDLGPDVPGY